MAGQAGHRPACRVDVALDLDQGDGALGQSSVRVTDRVAGVLPALVEQAPLRAPAVFHEAVAIEVARLVDPPERRQRDAARAARAGVVAGPGVGLAEEDEPQRRRVDAAVVGVVGRLAAARHLAAAHLVEDLARLGVVPWIVRRGLQAGQHGQRLDRDRRHERDRLEGGDDAVPPEQRREPRDPGGEVGLAVGRARRCATGRGRRAIGSGSGRAARDRSRCGRPRADDRRPTHSRNGRVVPSPRRHWWRS